MKKVLALAIVALVCVAIVAVADGDKKMGGKSTEGTITKLDMDGKMMMVKGADGKEATLYWNDSTKVEGGELKEGATVHYKAAEKDGKWWATWVHVGEMKMKGKM